MAITEFSKNYYEKMFPGCHSTFLETAPEFIERFDNFAFDEVVNQDDLDGKTRFMAIPATLLGSAVSVFLKEHIHNTFRSLGEKRLGVVGIWIASALGIASPLCMYGTIPIAASFFKSGIKDDCLATFMITGPATKITNLGAVKIVLGMKNFILYILFVAAFACLTGIVVNALIF